MMLILKSVLKIQIRYYIYSNTRNQILKDAFGLNPREADVLLSNINRKDPDSFLSAIKVCRSLGFSDDDILSNPTLLNRKPMVLEQQFLTLEEGGFHKITPAILLKYDGHYRKSVAELKINQYIHSSTNVAESFSKYFDPQPEDGVIDFNEFSDNERWRDIHTRLLKLYLGWRLQATKEEIEKLFRIHSILKNKSVRLMCENIRLALQVGLSLRRIRTAGYILHSYPKYTKEVLRDYSHIAGGDLKKAVKGCPKLLTISPMKYARIYGLLKKHEISDETIRNHLNVFQYAPRTVQYRLEDIDKVPELRVLKHHTKFLSLVVHHERAKSRMYFLQELEKKCLHLRVLALQHRLVNKNIKDDMHTSKEVSSFLRALLKCNSTQSEKCLKDHPFHSVVPFTQIEETYNYLKDVKFSNDAICRVITILLYPKECIKETLISIKNDPIMKKSTNQCDRLNLALYNIEKNYSFTGKGIWSHVTKRKQNE